MTTFIALFLFIVFLFLSGIHFYWGLGGNWGTDAVFPTKDDTIKPKMPGPVPTFVVALGLLIIGFFILLKAGLFPVSIPSWMNAYGLWILSGIFILRAIGDFYYVGFFKRIKDTKFGRHDTKYYSPLCLLIGVLILIMQFNTYE